GGDRAVGDRAPSLGERGGEALLALVGGLAGVAPPGGVEVLEPAQDLVQLAAFVEDGALDPLQLVEGVRACRRRDRRVGLRLDPGDGVDERLAHGTCPGAVAPLTPPARSWPWRRSRRIAPAPRSRAPPGPCGPA